MQCLFYTSLIYLVETFLQHCLVGEEGRHKVTLIVAYIHVVNVFKISFNFRRDENRLSTMLKHPSQTIVYDFFR